MTDTCVPLSKLFHVEYGNKFDLNKQTRMDTGGVLFVGRSGVNQGVSARVAVIDKVTPYPAGALTVALGGSVLSTFVQQEPFYTAQNVAVLTPRDKDMGLKERLYYAAAIYENRHLYTAFGREANSTLRNIELPPHVPSWVNSVTIPDVDHFREPSSDEQVTITKWADFTISDLFDVERGGKSKPSEVEIPLVSASARNNAVTGRVKRTPSGGAGCITVNGNGSVGETFYQPEPFAATGDVHVLTPKTPLTPEASLFVCQAIRRAGEGYNYGRKWGLEAVKKTVIKLPADANGDPDWVTMTEYIQGLPYSAAIPA